jgi:lactoylglutathione lyase
MTTAPSTNRITGVRRVGVPVTEQERALYFYGGVLDFRTRLDSPFPRGSLDRGGAEFTTADAAGDHSALAAAGVEVDDVLRFPGVPPMFSFRDPDGNTLDVVEPFRRRRDVRPPLSPSPRR